MKKHLRRTEKRCYLIIFDNFSAAGSGSTAQFFGVVHQICKWRTQWMQAFMFQALRKVELAIRGHNDCRLEDLSMMGVASHTGCNESLNSRHNKVWNSRLFIRSGGGGGYQIFCYVFRIKKLLYCTSLASFLLSTLLPIIYQIWLIFSFSTLQRSTPLATWALWWGPLSRASVRSYFFPSIDFKYATLIQICTVGTQPTVKS